MKFIRLILFTALVGSLQLHAQEQQEYDENGLPIEKVAPAANYTPSRMIDMRPSDKTPLISKSNERNPYARRSAADEARENGEENQEEIQIRQKLYSLSVTGKTQGPNGPRILLGDIILEKGKVLPPLLQQQVENLQVIEISENSIILGWLDLETRELTGKTMQVSYDLSPRITYALHGQGPLPQSTDSEEAQPLFGVMKVRPGQGAKNNGTDVSHQANNTQPEE